MGAFTYLVSAHNKIGGAVIEWVPLAIGVPLLVWGALGSWLSKCLGCPLEVGVFSNLVVALGGGCP